MLTKQDNFFEYGTSLLEVVLSITLVLLLVPFIYGQIANMNDTVTNIVMANKILKIHDGVKNYILVHSAEYADGENTPLEADELAEIAPGAVNGFVRKVSNGVVSLEAFLEFNIDNSKYKAADMAKYIGDDAAVVQSDNTAYSEYWAASLSDPDSFSPGNLVYRVSYNFSAGNENNYLHKIEFNNLNVMERNLNMNNKELRNVKSLTAEFFKATDGLIDSFATGCTKVNVETTNAIFEQRINMVSDVTFLSLVGGGGQYFDICNFANANLGVLAANEQGMNVVGDVKVDGAVEANKLEILNDTERSATFNGVTISGVTLNARNINTTILKAEGPGSKTLRIAGNDWPVTANSDFSGESSGKAKISGMDPKEVLITPSYTSAVYFKIGVVTGHN